MCSNTCNDSFVKKRGCQCHFIVNVKNKDPNIEILTYNTYEHEDEEGWPCHGRLDKFGGARSLCKSRLSREIVYFVENCFFMDVSTDVVYQKHIEQYVDMDVEDHDRDFFLTRKDVANIYNRLMKGKYQLDKKDEISVNLWYHKRLDVFFFFFIRSLMVQMFLL
jgi:hypothetical protein